MKRITTKPISEVPNWNAPDRGFALIAAISMAMLLAVVASIFTASVRSYIAEHSATFATAEAEAFAEAGVNLAVLDLVQAVSQGTRRRFPLDGTPTACRLPDLGVLAIRVRDEAGKVDLNIATEALLRALLTGAGLSATDVTAKIEAIADYKDSDSDRRLNGAETDEYRLAGRPGGPKDAPFDAVDELSRVFGFDSDLVNILRPFVTIHSGQDGIDPSVASPELASLLARGAGDSDFDAPGLFPGLLPGLFNGSSAVPAQFVTASIKRSYGIEVEARTARGASFVREAIVSLVDSSLRAPVLSDASSLSVAPKAAYRIWRWRRGDGVKAVTEPLQTSGLLPC